MRLVLAALVIPPTEPLRAPLQDGARRRSTARRRARCRPRRAPRPTGRPCGPPAATHRHGRARRRRDPVLYNRSVGVAGRGQNSGLRPACVEHYKRLDIATRIEEALGDDDGWCRSASTSRLMYWRRIAEACAACLSNRKRRTTRMTSYHPPRHPRKARKKPTRPWARRPCLIPRGLRGCGGGVAG